MDLTDTSSVIVDRFIYSNLTYAYLYNDYSIITQEQAEEIEDKIKNNARIIYLYADSKVIQDRIAARGDDYVNADMIDSILDRYEEVLSNSKLEILRIDTGKLKPDQVFAKVLGVYDTHL